MHVPGSHTEQGHVERSSAEPALHLSMLSCRLQGYMWHAGALV